MVIPEETISFNCPHHWKYAPDRPVHWKSQDTYWRSLRQTEPYFSWLGVLPRKHARAAAPAETAAPELIS